MKAESVMFALSEQGTGVTETWGSVVSGDLQIRLNSSRLWELGR